MAKVTVTEVVVVDGKPVVRGTLGDLAFEAAPFQWGRKMLMKVEGEGLGRGDRVAVGHAAKKALKAVGLELPEAVLKRPRKPKAEEAKVEAPEAPAEVEVAPEA
jgi:hypothetical protein